MSNRRILKFFSLAGAAAILVSSNLYAATIAMACFGILTHWWWIFLVAALFHGPGQWLLRQAAKHDPQWTAVYARALAHPLIREPHGMPSRGPRGRGRFCRSARSGWCDYEPGWQA
jgi:type IV secretory pathway TrbD component